MRLMYLTVLVVYIFSADSREVPDKPDKESLISTEETLELNGETLLYPGGPFVGLDSSEFLQEIMEEGETEAEINSRDSTEMKILKMLIKKLKKVDNKLDSLKEIKDDLASMENNLIEIQSQNTNIESLIGDIIGCQEGFFKAAGSSQCYKFYDDSTRSYTEAKEKCNSEGLVMAEPLNPINVRKHIAETYGQSKNAWAWCAARGNGANLVWERSGFTISNTDPLWWSNWPGHRVTSDWCLVLLGRQGYMDSAPNKPISADPCADSYYALCEYINE